MGIHKTYNKTESLGKACIAVSTVPSQYCLPLKLDITEALSGMPGRKFNYTTLFYLHLLSSPPIRTVKLFLP